MSRPISRDVPECLRRHGITRVSSNLAPGESVVLEAKEVMLLFGDEILSRLEGRRRCASKVSK